MKKPVFLFLFLFAAFSHCSSGSNYREFQTSLKEQEVFKRTDLHSGLEGNFLFYVSDEDSDGHIFLYNVDEAAHTVTAEVELPVKHYETDARILYAVAGTDSRVSATPKGRNAVRIQATVPTLAPLVIEIRKRTAQTR